MIASDLVEVAFKGSRKHIYANNDEIQVSVGDSVIVKAEKGIDFGIVSKVGRLVQVKESEEEIRKIIRKATEDEIKNLEKVRDSEDEASMIAKQKITRLNLNMKLVDVEMQFDSNKLTFFFTSDKRVDFRELVKELATRFKTRIELKQIGVRDEARRIGGCGNCGRELCCSSFIKEFEPITTQYAKDQNLPLNPGKLSGACGRLMCCLSYEREYYQDTLKKFPTLDTYFQLEKSKAVLIKIDVFRERLTFKTRDEEFLQIPLEEFNLALEEKRTSLIDENQFYRESRFQNH
jgi:cell fate regulator YaaT (PSP1 superfamily)